MYSPADAEGVRLGRCTAPTHPYPQVEGKARPGMDPDPPGWRAGRREAGPLGPHTLIPRSRVRPGQARTPIPLEWRPGGQAGLAVGEHPPLMDSPPQPVLERGSGGRLDLMEAGPVLRALQEPGVQRRAASTTLKSETPGLAWQTRVHPQQVPRVGARSRSPCPHDDPRAVQGSPARCCEARPGRPCVLARGSPRSPGKFPPKFCSISRTRARD